MYERSNTQQKFEFVNGLGNVASRAEAPDFEQGFDPEEECKTHLNVVVLIRD